MTMEAYVAYSAPSSGLLPLSAPTTILGASSFSGTGAVAIGFDFIFDGAVHTQFNSRPHALALGASAPPTSSATQLSDVSTMRILAPWGWGAAVTAPTDGYIRTELQGSAPHRLRVVDYRLRTAISSTDHWVIEFQTVMFEHRGRIEFRYGGEPVLAGAGGTGGDPKIGVRGDTSASADAYRDFLAHGHPFGGSSSSTAPLPAASFPDTWPGAGTMYVWELQVPVPEEYDPLEGTAFVGRNRPDAEPIVRMGRNTNWLIAHHGPPLLNVAPYALEQTDHVYIIPVSPSADGRDYVAQLASYSTVAGGSLSVVIDEDRAGGESQPATSADWAEAATDLSATLEDTSHWWDDFVVPLDHRTRLLRVRVTSEDGVPYRVLPLSLLLYPAARTELPLAPPSGAVPFGLASLLHADGSAVHPEVINRCWRSAAAVAQDLEQMVFSFVQDATTPRLTFVHSSALPARRLGTWHPVLPGQGGAEVDVRIYAKSTVDGSRIVVGEESGDSVEFDLDAHGGEYRLMTARLRLSRARPTIYAMAFPAPTGAITPLAVVGAWRPGA